MFFSALPLWTLFYNFPRTIKPPSPSLHFPPPQSVPLMHRSVKTSQLAPQPNYSDISFPATSRHRRWRPWSMFVQQHHHHHHQRQLHAPLLTTSSNSGSSCLSLVPPTFTRPPPHFKLTFFRQNKNPNFKVARVSRPDWNATSSAAGVRRLLRMLTKSPPHRSSLALERDFGFHERASRPSSILTVAGSRQLFAGFCDVWIFCGIQHTLWALALRRVECYSRMITYYCACRMRFADEFREFFRLNCGMI